MLRYIHISNQLKRIPHTDITNIDEDKVQLLHKIRSIRTKFSEIISFRPRSHVNRAAVRPAVQVGNFIHTHWKCHWLADEIIAVEVEFTNRFMKRIGK